MREEGEGEGEEAEWEGWDWGEGRGSRGEGGGTAFGFLEAWISKGTPSGNSLLWRPALVAAGTENQAWTSAKHCRQDILKCRHPQDLSEYSVRSPFCVLLLVFFLPQHVAQHWVWGHCHHSPLLPLLSEPPLNHNIYINHKLYYQIGIKCGTQINRSWHVLHTRFCSNSSIVRKQ